MMLNICPNCRKHLSREPLALLVLARSHGNEVHGGEAHLDEATKLLGYLLGGTGDDMGSWVPAVADANFQIVDAGDLLGLAPRAACSRENPLPHEARLI